MHPTFEKISEQEKIIQEYPYKFLSIRTLENGQCEVECEAFVLHPPAYFKEIHMKFIEMDIANWTSTMMNKFVVGEGYEVLCYTQAAALIFAKYEFTVVKVGVRTMFIM